MYTQREPKWNLLFRIGRLRAATLTPCREIPLHDHPNTSGLLIVLKGTIQIDICRKLRDRSGARFADLELLSRRRLWPGRVSKLNSGEANIHSIRPLSNECVMLDLMVHAKRCVNRSWYFPTTRFYHYGSTIHARVLYRPYAVI